MSNIVLGIISSSVVFLLVLIAIVVVCCLYWGVEADERLRALTNEYIEENR